MLHLDPKALESATDAAMSRFNDDTAPRRCENWRAHLREMTSDAIRTYLSASLPADADALVERLKACANGIGSFKGPSGDYGLCDESASLIQSQAVRIAELEAGMARQMSWVRAALDCKEWGWDGDQREAAEIEYAEARALLNRRAEG